MEVTARRERPARRHLGRCRTHRHDTLPGSMAMSLMGTCPGSALPPRQACLIDRLGRAVTR